MVRTRKGRQVCRRCGMPARRKSKIDGKWVCHTDDRFERRNGRARTEAECMAAAIRSEG